MPVFLLLLLVLTACAAPREMAPTAAEPSARYREAAPADLAGWDQDRMDDVLPALLRSCRVWVQKAPQAPIASGRFGTAADWQRACRAVVGVEKDILLPSTLLNHFTAWEVTRADGRAGLFTGYYEPELRGSYQPTEKNLTPLYARPSDLVEVDLGAFRPALEGQRLAGRVESGKLVPYADRAQIASGALDGQGLELVWVEDPIDAFFLEVQGSGVIRLPDGSARRIGYAAQNGHAYHAIGKTLVERGALEKDKVSLQSIRAWLRANPVYAREVMDTNRSAVFFRWTDAEGAMGAQGLALTPLRSVAVDPRHVPLGAPVWVRVADGQLARLMVAQDTGGAIKGPARADIFFGPGAGAEDAAGKLKAAGRLWVFLPKGVTPRAFDPDRP